MKIKKVIEDASSIRTKSDSVNISELDNNIIEYVKTLEPEFQEMLLATSGNDSKHGSKSRHYKNKAIDFRFNNKLYQRIKKDPNRLKYGITLLDPGHGTAPHLHLSVGNATENKKDVWLDPHSKEAKELINKIPEEEIEEKIATSNNILTKEPKIPSLATTPVDSNITYASLPETEEKKIKKETGISEAQIKKLLKQERQKIEEQFVNAFQEKNVIEQEYQPQPQQQQDLSYLYNYIDIETFNNGGEKEQCECGCPGKPPCPDKPVKKDNFENAQKLFDPVYSKLAKAYGYDPNSGDDYEKLIRDKRIHEYVRAGLDQAFGYTPDSLSDERLVPPMNEKLSEFQQLILNTDDKEIRELLSKDYREAGLFNMGDYLPENVSIWKALKYAKEFKKLRKKGYTFNNGGKIK